MTHVAVIGAGSVGTALADGLAAAGHSVTIGVRDPGDAKHQDLSSRLAVRGVADAVVGGEVVVLAVPAAALEATIGPLALSPGQIVVDASNAVATPLPVGFDTTGEYVASLIPAGVLLVKAFNTIGAEHLRDGRLDGARAFLPIAGDDAGRALVVQLGTDLGFDVADLGGRNAIRLVEDHARLWIHLAFRCGWGRDFGFTVARP